MRYEVLPIESFGAALLQEGDLDPVYNAVHRARMPPEQLYRWLLSYWCCYHAGLSSYISESEGVHYWYLMNLMASNEVKSPVGGRWPRGRERRHFRGQRCVDAVSYLTRAFPHPEDAVRWLGGGPYRYVRGRVTTWPLFGPWIAFKVGDMLERCVGVPVQFSDAEVFLFDSPRDAAALWATETGLPREENSVLAACRYLQRTLGHLPAPPNGDRRLNLQEWETILCKWGSHVKGHYPVGIDTRELNEALEVWAKVSPTAERMLL